jgi:hypothetical protein
MNFQYFLPGVSRQSVTRELLIAAGLGAVLRDRMTANDLCGQGSLALADVTSGPDGYSGTILYPLTEAEQEADEDAPPPRIGYYKDEQTWDKFAGYYVGWNPDALPAPEDLEQDVMLKGFYETLGDGRRWLCPLIRMVNGGNNLPDVWGVRNGKFTMSVKPDWNWAWDLSGEVWDYYSREADIPFELAFEWAVRLLGINYRIGPVEATALGLFGRNDYMPVLRASIHGPFFEKLLAAQKKTPESSVQTDASSTPGVEG